MGNKLSDSMDWSFSALSLLLPRSEYGKIQTFIKKETLAQVFSFEFCEIFRNIFFTEHLWATASASHSEQTALLPGLLKISNTTTD